VPTWNYLSVEVRGRLTVEQDPQQMKPYLEALTDKMELGRDMAWAVSDAPDSYIERLSMGIIGFELTIEDITYVRKLSQNKDDPDYQGVHGAFAASRVPQEQALANEMQKERRT